MESEKDIEDGPTVAGGEDSDEEDVLDVQAGRAKRGRTRKAASSVDTFGSRTRNDDDDVFAHNAWDNDTWGEEQAAEAETVVARHRQVVVPTERPVEHERKAATAWDKFYGIHQNKFFKDRNWLRLEFPELFAIPDAATSVAQLRRLWPVAADSLTRSRIWPDGGKPGPAAVQFRVMEVGCGVGNTVFPLLTLQPDPRLFVYACDFAPSAVEIVKVAALRDRGHGRQLSEIAERRLARPAAASAGPQSTRQYEPARCLAFVCDVANSPLDPPVAAASIDVAVMIFVLSAIRPDAMADVLRKIYTALKPGGMLLFRDYGRYDLAQLRFKEKNVLGDNFYARGDGTRVYFFTEDELRSLMEGAGFVVEQNSSDRRLIVNRTRRLQMHRVWQQGKYRKPLTDSNGTGSASPPPPPPNVPL